MTDKQIIINGVDISKCKHYDEVSNYCDQSYLGEGGLLKNTKNPKRCDCSPNCYYKQLTRKEQELQQAMDNYVQLDLQRVKEYNELVDLYKAKEQECERLKAEIKHYKQIAQYHGNLSVKYTNKSAKYEQTLTEIKDMCSEMNCESLMQNSWCGNTDFKMGCCEKLFKKQILQKISEVSNDRQKQS